VRKGVGRERGQKGKERRERGGREGKGGGEKGEGGEGKGCPIFLDNNVGNPSCVPVVDP